MHIHSQAQSLFNRACDFDLLSTIETNSMVLYLVSLALFGETSMEREQSSGGHSRGPRSAGSAQRGSQRMNVK